MIIMCQLKVQCGFLKNQVEIPRMKNTTQKKVETDWVGATAYHRSRAGSQEI